MFVLVSRVQTQWSVQKTCIAKGSEEGMYIPNPLRRPVPWNVPARQVCQAPVRHIAPVVAARRKAANLQGKDGETYPEHTYKQLRLLHKLCSIIQHTRAQNYKVRTEVTLHYVDCCWYANVDNNNISLGEYICECTKQESAKSKLPPWY
jgi:hypothetical protein